MDTEKQVDDDWDTDDNPDPKAEAEGEALHAAYTSKLYDVLNKVKAGEMTEDECVAAGLQLRKDLGMKSPFTPAQDAAAIRRRMYHFLRPGERERLWREEGIAAD